MHVRINTYILVGYFSGYLLETCFLQIWGGGGAGGVKPPISVYISIAYYMQNGYNGTR